jgi:hypothetical protein
LPTFIHAGKFCVFVEVTFPLYQIGIVCIFVSNPCVYLCVGADRCVLSSVGDAREAMINAATDALSAYGATVPASQRIGTLPSPYSIRLLPLYIQSMLKYVSIEVSVQLRKNGGTCTCIGLNKYAVWMIGCSGISSQQIS